MKKLTKEIICILPCNGLDKSLGVIAREVSLMVIEKMPDVQLICPVLLNNGDKRYEDLIQTSKIIIINGCMTRCPTKLIEKRKLKPFKQIMIPDMSKKHKVKPSKDLILNEDNIKLAELIADEIIIDLNKSDQEKNIDIREFQEQEYFDITVDKYYFTVPKKEGYFFNENDCWIKPEGNTALIGITDYLQNAASDILFVDLPELGSEIEQFDDVGSFESSKTVLQLISPGAGRIIAINKSLEQNPEYVNQDPYRKGWFVEIELKNFEEDKELLMNGPEYFDYMKIKIMKEKNHLDQIKSERDV
ncbi:MAG: glycine cleavage system protein H [Candidatus Lokiarchaeota archaeon]|nr:glycine cleavage system protein H [Candidatus Lokiarchaeota archaeon]